MAPFVAGVKRNYIFGGICSIASNASIKVGVYCKVNFDLYLPIIQIISNLVGIAPTFFLLTDWKKRSD